jgi:hypothetical protein
MLPLGFAHPAVDRHQNLPITGPLMLRLTLSLRPVNNIAELFVLNPDFPLDQHF